MIACTSATRSTVVVGATVVVGEVVDNSVVVGATEVVVAGIDVVVSGGVVRTGVVAGVPLSEHPATTSTNVNKAQTHCRKIVPYPASAAT